jgi:hypothetical protein
MMGCALNISYAYAHGMVCFQGHSTQCNQVLPIHYRMEGHVLTLKMATKHFLINMMVS